MSDNPKTIDTERKKGGRPPKDEDEKIAERWTVNFNQTESNIVQMKADKTGKRPPHYIHDAALSANVKSHINDEQVIMVRNIANMGNNINQIAKRANQGGLVAIKTLAEETVGRLSELIKRVVRGGDLTVAS